MKNTSIDIQENQSFLFNISFFDDIEKFDLIACNLNIIFMALGFVVNIISISAFSQKILRKRKFNWYLIVLTIVDLIFCLIVFTDYIFSVFHDKRIFLHALNKITYVIIDFTIHTSDSYMAVLTLLLSLDRLYAIKKPMQIRQFITNLHAKKMMGITLLILILLKVASHIFCGLNIGGKFHLSYCSFGSPIIFNLIPLFIVLVLNIWLVEEMISYVRKQKQPDISKIVRFSITAVLNSEEHKRGHINSKISLRHFGKKKISKTQKSHYVVILVHSVWSILAATPYYTLNPYFSSFKLNVLSDVSKKIILSQIVASILFNSNHCFNFFIYFSFYSEFRAVVINFFLQIFALKKCVILKF